MSTRARLLHVLLILLALALVPAATASANPRPSAHQDEWVDVEDTVDDVTDAVAPDGEEDVTDDELADEEITTEEDEWSDDDEAAEGDWVDEDEIDDVPVIQYAKGRTVKGKVALLRRNGKAAIPRSAPKRVKLVIAAANRIVGKPYKWGGGHARVEDRGYDCSGTVSYALIRSALLDAPLVSGGFAKWGAGGAGKWITIYANKGHVYMEVAGLRLDTSAMGDSSGKGPRWRPAIGKRPGFKVRHIAGL